MPSEGSAEQIGWIKIEFAEAKKRIGRIRERGEVDDETIDSLEAKIVDAEAGVRQAGSDRGDRDQAGDRLKEALRALYGLVDEWSEADTQLDQAWKKLTEAKSVGGCPKCGDVVSDAWISELKEKLRKVKRVRDSSLARQLTKDIKRATTYMMRCDWSRQIIDWACVNYHDIQWADTVEARIALDKGLRAMMSGVPCYELVDSAIHILTLRDSESGSSSSPQGPQPPVLSLR